MHAHLGIGEWFVIGMIVVLVVGACLTAWRRASDEVASPPHVVPIGPADAPLGVVLPPGWTAKLLKPVPPMLWDWEASGDFDGHDALVVVDDFASASGGDVLASSCGVCGQPAVLHRRVRARVRTMA